MAELREYAMTAREVEHLIRVGLRYPGVVAGGGPAVNEVWKTLGKKYGFRWQTARPTATMGLRFFLAEPLENT